MPGELRGTNRVKFQLRNPVAAEDEETLLAIGLSPSTPPRRCRFRTLDHTANPWREQCFRRGPGDRKVEDLVGLLVRPRLSLSEISIQLACSRESGDASFMGDTLKLIWRQSSGCSDQEFPRWRC